MKKIFKICITLIMGVIMGLSIMGCSENGIQDSGYEKQNYCLKISADKQIYGIEEDIIIDIILENQSGEDIDISYYFPWVIPDSSTGQFPAIEQSPEMTKLAFKNGESIRITDNLNGCFSVGQHKLKYRAVFYLDEEKTESVVEVRSNTINISIIK